jgi:hypothetical protein
MSDEKFLYRYDFDSLTSHRGIFGFEIDGSVLLYKFKVVKETECGYWIIDYNDSGQLIRGRLFRRKWFNKKSRYTWAKESEVEALKDYIRRKKYHAKKVKQKLDEIQWALSLGENLLNKIENESKIIKEN